MSCWYDLSSLPSYNPSSQRAQTSSTSTSVERPGFTCMGCVVTSSSGPDLYVKRSPLLSEDQKFWLVSYMSFAAKSHTNFPISRSEKKKWYKLCIKTDNLESSNVVGKVSELVEKKYLQNMVMKYKNFFFLDSKIDDEVNYTHVDSTLLNESQNLPFLDEIKAHVFYFKAEDATFSLAPLASKTRQAPQPPLTLCRDETTYHLMAFVTAPSSYMKSASCSYYVRPWSQYNNFGNIEDISPFSFPERSITINILNTINNDFFFFFFFFFTININSFSSPSISIVSNIVLIVSNIVSCTSV